MKIVCVCSLVIALGLASTSANAKPHTATNDSETTSALPSKKITVDIKKAGARSALTALLENSGVKYQIAEEITNDIKVNVEAKKTKWSEVFSKLLQQAKLTYHMSEDGTLEITPDVVVNKTMPETFEEGPTTTEDSIE